MVRRRAGEVHAFGREPHRGDSGVARGEDPRPDHPPFDLRLDVVRVRDLLGDLRVGVGADEVAIEEQDLGQRGRDGRAQVRLADRLERAVVTTELELGRPGITGQPLDPGRVDRGRVGVDPGAELGERGLAAPIQRTCLVEPAFHRTQDRERADDDRLHLAIALR